MLYLLDTSAFSDLMREHAGYRERIGRLATDARLIICTIVRGEVAYGPAPAWKEA